MQTQAHTQAALQAQLEAQEGADVWWSSLIRTRFEDGAVNVAWDAFVRLFRAKFPCIVWGLVGQQVRPVVSVGSLDANAMEAQVAF
ncbi:hypothetical protein Taro_016108 [Colocasia esculenta]|uniref:Uncharacterized protein n=1 Tax=Colocasia esculenta TaxID=4460 RepID=A0A843UJQ9_COLES|nr:hypothetical protein [Colocasia esculenta]